MSTVTQLRTELIHHKPAICCGVRANDSLTLCKFGAAIQTAWVERWLP